jgi:hypothetical protein
MPCAACSTCSVDCAACSAHLGRARQLRHACGPEGRAASWPCSPRWALALQQPILTARRISKHPPLDRNAPAAAQEAGDALRGAEALPASACEVHPASTQGTGAPAPGSLPAQAEVAGGEGGGGGEIGGGDRGNGGGGDRVDERGGDGGGGGGAGVLLDAGVAPMSVSVTVSLPMALSEKD